ncbi:MAG: hypothetical protein JSW51_12255, partial [Gemmatimonadota bacterium]
TVNQNMEIDEVRILSTALYKDDFGKYQRPYLGRERQTTLLLNWENAVGSPGATEYISDDLNRIPVIFPTGASTDSRIDTSQFKWGSQSLYCGGFTSTTTPSNVDGVWMDHTGRNYNSNRDVNYNQTDGRYEHVLDFGFEPFTCEGWVRFEVLPSAMGNDGVTLFSAYHRGLTGAPLGTWGDWFLEFNNSNQMAFSYYGNEMGWGSYLPGAKSIGSPDLQTGQWYHWAICRNASGDFSQFWDGKRIFHDPGAIGTQYFGKAYGSRIALGRRYVTNGAARQRPLQGWLDDIRFTCGTAYYDGATYTVPTGPFTPDDREDDAGLPSPTSPQGPPSPQSPQGLSPQSPLPGEFFAGEDGGWEPDDL